MVSVFFFFLFIVRIEICFCRNFCYYVGLLVIMYLVLRVNIIGILCFLVYLIVFIVVFGIGLFGL